MNDTLEQRINALSDEELKRMLTIDADQYRPEALELGGAEARRRELEIEAPAEDATASSVASALGAFADGVASEFRAGGFIAAGRRITCTHCSGESFKLRPAVVNTRGLTFFGLDWLDRGATVLVCEACGLLMWFRVAPERAHD